MTRPVPDGWIGVVGAGTFFVGAAIATSVGVWDVSGAALLTGVSRAPVAWRWGNALLALGSATSALGMLLIGMESATLSARTGAALWLAAGAAGLVGFILQGEGTLLAARLWSDTGSIPSWAERVARTAGIAIGLFMAGGILGSVALGWYLRAARGLSGEWLAAGVIVLCMALAFAAMRIPAAAVLLSGWVAVARLWFPS